MDVISRQIVADEATLHCLLLGAGPPLVLLDNGMVSSNPVWAAMPVAFVGRLGTLAKHFSVVLPDPRGSGRSVHRGGPVTHDLPADDVATIVEDLGLRRPLICGFSDGGSVALVFGLRHPGIAGGLVCLGGHDTFDPEPGATTYVLSRRMLGGHPEATQADPDLVSSRQPELAAMFEIMRADHDGAQGTGHSRTVLAMTFDRITRPHGYSLADLAGIDAPTLIDVGDRDPFCTVDDAVKAYSALPHGELAVHPDTSHLIASNAVQTLIDFGARQLGSRPT
jgi:pimeloyl-ACP methyl ester carboxylesterase